MQSRLGNRSNLPLRASWGLKVVINVSRKLPRSPTFTGFASPHTLSPARGVDKPKGLGKDILQSLTAEERDRLAGTCPALASLTNPDHPGPENPQQHQLSELVDANAELLNMYKLNTKSLLLREPRIMSACLWEFQEFMLASGFHSEGIAYLLGQAPEAVSKATLLSAGRTLLQLKSMGIAPEVARQLVLVHPQLLYLDERGVAGLVRLIAKFSGSIGAC
ncbi:hypothetical protein DUNSADRAFT_17708 [Dunaliella salina]|uniref:Uncharacterized protein n=1 Tax=Dunaliella salina TaxID=3046 RepID=A0ABQ7GZV9_DUNSA|nr:hypothetical protein DUNSADRAFT_17708 [Dunaliella salina]|eukprot:KAF5840107.1 hypothetical protein DUNSADRAFT_17708 [Dunaliella salina]